MKKLGLLILAFIMCVGYDHYTIDVKNFDKYEALGLQVVSPGGIATCLSGWCWMQQVFTDPATGQQYSQMFKAYVPAGNPYHLDIQPEGNPTTYGIVEIKGERVGYSLRDAAKEPSHGLVFGENSDSTMVPVPPGPDQINASTEMRTVLKPSNGADNSAPVKSQDNPSGANGNPNPDYMTTGRILLAVFSSKLTVGKIPNTKAELEQSLKKAEANLKQSSLNDVELNNLAAQMIAAGVKIPDSIKNSVSRPKSANSKPLVKLSSLSAIKEFNLNDVSNIKPLLDAIKSGDVKKIASLSELSVSAYAHGGDLAKALAPYVNSSGVLVPNKINFRYGPAPFDKYNLKTLASSPYGRLVRRAVNINQMAWANASANGVDIGKSQPALVGSAALLKIADDRFANTIQLNPSAVDQAEAFVAVAQIIGEVGMGASDGIWDSVNGFGEAIYAVPKIGGALMDFTKYSIQYPDLAGQKMWGVMQKTPEFMTRFASEAWKQAKGFPGLSPYDQTRIVSRIGTEVVVTFVGGEVLEGLKGLEAIEAGAQITSKFSTTFAEQGSNLMKSFGRAEAQALAPKLGEKYAAAWVMDEGYVSAFEGAIEKVTLQPGQVFVQGRFEGQGVGNWFGTMSANTAEQFEAHYFTKAYNGQTFDLQKFYRVKEKAAAFAGHVANGKGYQIFVPKNIPLAEIFEEIPGATIRY